MSNIHVTQKPIQRASIYTLHQVTLNKQQCYGKYFDYTKIKRNNLIDVIAWNKQIFKDEHPQIEFNEFLLPIYESYSIGKGIMFVIPKFKDRLNKYTLRKGALQEKQFRYIAQQLIKAVYGLLLSGFLPINLRLEHFVSYDNKWKIQSLIQADNISLNSQTPNSQACEYSWRSEYQAPECYSRTSSNFSNDQLKKMLVWDFGNMIIDMALGHHLLKSQQIMRRFQNKPFSFQSVGIKIGETFSPQLRQILGKMCHENPGQRMSLSQLLSSGFFSKEVAQHFMDRKKSRNEDYGEVIRQEEEEDMIGQQEILRQREEEEETIEHEQVQEQKNKVRDEEDKQKNIVKYLCYAQGQSMIVNENSKKQTCESIQTEVTDRYSIKNIVGQFENLHEKTKIITGSFQKFKQAINLCKNEQKKEQLLILTKYSLQFFRCLEICSLVSILDNRNKIEFKSKEPELSWNNFYESEEFGELKKEYQKEKSESLEKLKQIRKKCLSFQCFSPDLATQQIQRFVKELSPELVHYEDIRVPYLTIIKKSYDLLASHYPKEKTQKWASVGMFITFCMTIQEMYTPQNYHKNFKFYFKQLKKKGCEYVNNTEYRNYLENTDKQILVQNSIFMIKTYYEII